MADKRRRFVNFILADDHTSADFQIYTPPDEDGRQSVAATRTVAFSSFPTEQVSLLALIGFNYLLSARNNRADEPDAEELVAVLEKLTNEVVTNNFRPGRAGVEAEPDDIVVALAEATGRPVDVVQQEVDERMHLDASGQPKLDARGRKQRVFTKRVLDELAADPKVKPIMARLAKERADRMAKDAKAKPGTATSRLGSLFAAPEPEPVQEAAQ